MNKKRRINTAKGRVLTGYRYEVWQDGICVATAEGPGAEVEAAHYALVYGQDGSVTTRAIPIYARIKERTRDR